MRGVQRSPWHDPRPAPAAFFSPSIVVTPERMSMRNVRFLIPLQMQIGFKPSMISCSFMPVPLGEIGLMASPLYDRNLLRSRSGFNLLLEKTGSSAVRLLHGNNQLPCFERRFHDNRELAAKSRKRDRRFSVLLAEHRAAAATATLGRVCMLRPLLREVCVRYRCSCRAGLQLRCS